MSSSAEADELVFLLLKSMATLAGVYPESVEGRGQQRKIKKKVRNKIKNKK